MARKRKQQKVSKKQGQKKENNKQPKKAFALLAVAVAFLVIGVHQSITVGFQESYWIFMFSIVLLFLYQYINKNAEKN